jgi:preprotein translocase subunit SecD
VKQASVQRHPVTDKPEIHFGLDPEGTRIFEQVTREYSPDGDRSWQLAIIVDGELYSAPVIRGAIPGGRGSITGNFTQSEAVELANALGNSFETLVTIISEKVLDGPTETGLDGKSSVGFLTAPILIAFALAIVIFVVVIVVMILAARRQPAEQRRSSGTPPSSPPQ